MGCSQLSRKMFCGLFVLFFVQICHLSSQDTTYIHIATISEKATFITTDKLLNVFVITERGELVKYTPEGKEKFRYNNFSLGNPTLADATNPFQILLYYPEFQTIVTLDNTLNEAARYELFDLQVNEVEALCFANDGNLWLYDPVTFTLKKINRNGEILLESEIFTFLFDELPQPNFLIERNNQIYLNDPAKGIFVFDVYAAFEELIELKELTSFQILDRKIVYQNEGDLEVFSPQMLLKDSRTLPKIPTTKMTNPNVGIVGTGHTLSLQSDSDSDSILHLHVQKNRLFLATEDDIHFFEIH